jgi:hypothetical protein
MSNVLEYKRKEAVQRMSMKNGVAAEDHYMDTAKRKYQPRKSDTFIIGHRRSLPSLTRFRFFSLPEFRPFSRKSPIPPSQKKITHPSLAAVAAPRLPGERPHSSQIQPTVCTHPTPIPRRPWATQISATLVCLNLVGDGVEEWRGGCCEKR